MFILIQQLFDGLTTGFKGLTSAEMLVKKFGSSTDNLETCQLGKDLYQLTGNQHFSKAIYKFMVKYKDVNLKDIQRIYKGGYLKYENEKLLIRITQNNRIDFRTKILTYILSTYCSLYAAAGLYPSFSQGKIDWFYYLLVIIFVFFIPLLMFAFKQRTYNIAQEIQEKLQNEAESTKQSRFNKFIRQWRSNR